MNTVTSKRASRSLATALQLMGARLWARARFALRRFAALHAAARMRQARLEIQRFRECHRWQSDGEDEPRSALHR